MEWINIKEYGNYNVVASGKYPINADATKWRSWEIRKFGKRFQLMLTTPILENETEYVSVGLTWKMMRAFFIEMEQHYGKEGMERDMGIEIIIKDREKWNNKLRGNNGCGNIEEMWNNMMT